ncbi:hypothetical protein [Mycobacterium sp.]|uniref:hypothetical protein n=1 Tax=Mycobacterium sp. TaxID=1785 RepID=UPI003C505F32
MRFTMHRCITVTTLAGAAISSQLTPATARAGLHNITYIARIDGVAPSSQATFVTNNNQTNTAPLSSMPGNAFEANAVLADPDQAGMQVSVRWPYAANVHCEIDVDGNIATQVDHFVQPAPGSADPMNGVLRWGATLPNP